MKVGIVEGGVASKGMRGALSGGMYLRMRIEIPTIANASNVPTLTYYQKSQIASSFLYRDSELYAVSHRNFETLQKHDNKILSATPATTFILVVCTIF